MSHKYDTKSHENYNVKSFEINVKIDIVSHKMFEIDKLKLSFKKIKIIRLKSKL